MSERHGGAPARIDRRVGVRVALALAVGLGFGACKSRETRRPNVVLIVVDTLRQDAVGAYGGQARTPFIDGLAAGGVRFSSAVAQAPWTLPSIASLLSSRYPSEHGQGVNVGHALPSLPTLPERMRAAGYRTAAFVEVDWPYIRRGFDTFEAPLAVGEVRYGAAAQRRGSLTVTDAIRWLRHNSDAPFLLLVHSYEVHDYFLGKPRAREEALRRHPGYRGPFLSWRPRPPEEAIGSELVKQLLAADDQDIEFVRSLYDSGVGAMDRDIGRLLAALARFGLRDDTAVILTSDHGEGFAPRRHRVSHGGRLHEDLLRVPLIVSWPGRIAPGVVTGRVQLIDVAPTILALAGLDPEAGGEAGCRGRPLLARRKWLGFLAAGSTLRPAELPAVPALAEESAWLVLPSGERIRSSVRQTALYAGDLKLIRSGERQELYDVARDPAEEHDLAGQSASTAALGREMDALLGKLGSGAAPGVDLEEALRSLGYIR